jgi:hypothetical protein
VSVAGWCEISSSRFLVSLPREDNLEVAPRSGTSLPPTVAGKRARSLRHLVILETLLELLVREDDVVQAVERVTSQRAAYCQGLRGQVLTALLPARECGCGGRLVSEALREGRDERWLGLCKECGSMTTFLRSSRSAFRAIHSQPSSSAQASRRASNPRRGSGSFGSPQASLECELDLLSACLRRLRLHASRSKHRRIPDRS